VIAALQGDVFLRGWGNGGERTGETSAGFTGWESLILFIHVKSSSIRWMQVFGVDRII